MEYFLGLTTYWYTKQASTNLRPQYISDHSDMKLEINHRKINGKTCNDQTCKWSQGDKQHATKKSVGQRGNQKMPWDKQQWKHNFQKSVGCSVSGSKRKVCSDIGLTQKKKKKGKKNLKTT